MLIRMTVAVIADIVGSRQLDDRSSSQRRIEHAIETVDEVGPQSRSRMVATVSDEFQAVFDELDAALAWVMLLRLALPEGIDLRFGLGLGEISSVDSDSEHIYDGPGWWAAREAIETVHRLEDRTVPHARTFVVGGGVQDEDMSDRLRVVNAFALARDEVIGRMSDRERRLTYGRCTGQTQRALANAEGVTQSAVSQALHASGAAGLVAGYRLMIGEQP